MSEWVSLGRVGVRHEYTNGGDMVELMPLPCTAELMRRRGVLFRKLSHGMWEWLALREGFHGLMDGDELILSMRICRPDFFPYTVCDGYDPRKVYRIDVEGSGELDVMSLLRPIDGEEKRYGNDFCRIVWSPSKQWLEEKMVPPAQDTAGRPGGKGADASRMDRESCDVTLRFRARSYVWEYFFILRHPDDDRGPRLLLEDASQCVSFGTPEAQKDSIFGPNVWRIASLEPVKSFEQDEYHLILSEIIQRVPPRKRIVARFLPSPQAGRYSSGSEGAIRQICYI
ncbi:hypothetical protein [Akkermansia glycaniphila]|uniref:Uncharacterized protein n=1 Tax=Akkermansia glycaniphila TaxID=1679444 RepID=A0A1C7PC05_9BACT|nr:hypothetical protein [Akkermansia glycaniphila]OCA03067.1 hypothetical protein AC781_06775 [Akkermansia glycaniphila]SEH86327.1 Hypothetical protein PYTT_1289 [Akkermansia glycaniphila]